MPRGVVLRTPTFGEVRIRSDRYGKAAQCLLYCPCGREFQRHVSARHGPFVIGLDHERTAETDRSIIVGKGADNIGSAYDFLVDALQRVG